MIETHPWGIFATSHPKYLILGSFPTKTSVGYNWFYGSKRNQFWPILESVYKVKLSDTSSRQELLKRLNTAIADIIYQCERKKESSLDMNLTNIVYNDEAISNFLKLNKIEKIYFTSRFVEKKFKKIFKEVNITLVTLPSPSPRYVALTKEEKIRIYKSLLPKFL